MTFADDIKAKIKDVDVEKQLTALVDEAEHLMGSAVGKAGDVAHDKRDDVESWLQTAAGKVNDRTDGKYADKVAKAQAALLSGVDKIAEKRAAVGEQTDGQADGSSPSEPIELPGPDDSL